MRKQHRDILDIYIQFRQSIKNLMKSKSYDEKKCVVITKESIFNWKNYYEYSKELRTNNYKINEWECKMDNKFGNNKPTIELKYFKEFIEIKEHLSRNKGISFINIEFFNYFSPSNKRVKEFNCYIGNGKIILEFKKDNIYKNRLICKIGSKSSSKYVIYEGINYLNENLIKDFVNTKNDEIMTKDKDKLASLNGVKIEVFNCYKYQSNEIYIGNNNINNNDISNKNNNEISNSKNKKNINNYTKEEEFNYNIPDQILEILIRLYILNNDIRHKISNNYKASDEYYYANKITLIYDFMDYSLSMEFFKKFQYNAQ